MGDDIINRLQCTYRSGEWPCEKCTFCAARAEIERLRADLYHVLYCPVSDCWQCAQIEEARRGG